MPHICYICPLFHVHIWHNYVSIYFSWTHSNENLTRSTGIHTFHIPCMSLEQVCPPHSTYMSNCTSLVVCLQNLHYCANPSKINKLQHLFTILQQSMCQQQIYPSNTTNMPHSVNYLTWIFGISMPIYMLHMKVLPLMM